MTWQTRGPAAGPHSSQWRRDRAESSLSISSLSPACSRESSGQPQTSALIPRSQLLRQVQGQREAGKGRCPTCERRGVFKGLSDGPGLGPRGTATGSSPGSRLRLARAGASGFCRMSLLISPRGQADPVGRTLSLQASSVPKKAITLAAGWIFLTLLAGSPPLPAPSFTLHMGAGSDKSHRSTGRCEASTNTGPERGRYAPWGQLRGHSHSDRQCRGSNPTLRRPTPVLSNYCLRSSAV